MYLDLPISPIVQVKKPRRRLLRLHFLTYTFEEISCPICTSYFSTVPNSIKGGFFMFRFMVTSEGGLTAAGYAVCIIGMILLFLAGVLLSGKNKKRKSMPAKQLAFCAMGLALAYLASYIKPVELPFGGTVTLFSMLFIVLIAYWYGTKTGILVGLAYGILQFIQEPYVLSFFQVCCDYILAFAALGIAGLFQNRKNGLRNGYLIAILARGFFHTLGGYLYWMDYMPEEFPQSLAALYPVIYNYSYILAEGVLTLIVISIPAVSNAINQVTRIASTPAYHI